MLLGPECGRKMSVLVSVHLVIDGDGVNFDPGVRVSLKKLDEILSVGCKPAFLHTATEHRPSALHPSRGTPHAGEQIEIGTNLLRLAKRRHDPGSVLFDAEAFQIRIGFRSVIVTVHLRRVVSRSKARPSYRKAQS